VLYETIGKMAGINVVFDSQYPSQTRNANMDVANMPIEQAFDYLAILTHTYWKPITSNTIFVAEDNPTKRHEYEDEVMKVFYLNNATSVQEVQEIATAIRTVADIRRVFPYNSQKALIVRATVDQMALTEKLLHDLDKPKSEVVIDVIVMQVNSQYSRSLAATLSSAGTTGLQQAIGFLPTTTSSGTTTSGTIPLSQVGHLSINDFSTSLPGAIVNAVIFRRADEDNEQTAGSSFRRHESGTHHRRAHPIRNRKLLVGRFRKQQRESAGVDAVQLL
jgi:general secretion pathway protein D